MRDSTFIAGTSVGLLFTIVRAAAIRTGWTIAGEQERAYTTIRTTLDRLFHKGLLQREKDGLAWRYTPVVSESAFERTLADQFSAALLATHGEKGLAAFVDAAARDDGDLLDKLAALVERRRKAGR